jgi:hypothetical protein
MAARRNRCRSLLQLPRVTRKPEPATGLWGAQSRSCSLPVLVKQTTEEVASAHGASVILAKNGQPGERAWRTKHECPVGTVAVVMPDVDPKDLLQVATANDQEPVQALGADRPHPALRVRVRPGRLHGRQEHLGTIRAEHIVEAAGELRVPIAQHKASPSALFAQHTQQVAGLLSDPLAVRVGGDAGQVNPAGVQFDEEQHIQPPQPDRVDGKKSHATIPAACWRRNARQVVAARRGAGSSPWRRSVVRITVAERRTPRWSSSPWMRW